MLCGVTTKEGSQCANTPVLPEMGTTAILKQRSYCGSAVGFSARVLALPRIGLPLLEAALASPLIFFSLHLPSPRPRVPGLKIRAGVIGVW